jgi:hypothetical protein
MIGVPNRSPANGGESMRRRAGVFRFAPLSPAELAAAFGLALAAVGGLRLLRRHTAPRSAL